jgi:hypothetical protein
MRLALGILVGVLVTIPRTSLAQAIGSWDDGRIVVDVNPFGTASSLSRDREFQGRAITFGEIRSSVATYPEPSLATPFLLDVGGSFRLSEWFAVGVAYSRIEHEDAVGLATTVPHPTYLAAPATNTGATGELARTEATTNFYVAVMPLRIKGAELRLMAGPTHFSLGADMVSDVLYSQTFDASSPQQNITITGSTTSRIKGSDVGFHVGGDVTYFLTKVVGIAGGMRFNRGTVAFKEPLSNLDQQIRVGNTVGFVGLRFRLGR